MKRVYSVYDRQGLVILKIDSHDYSCVCVSAIFYDERSDRR